MTRLGASAVSAKAERFRESVIREMNRLAVAAGAVSLSQGFPDFAAPDEIKEAAVEAIRDDRGQGLTVRSPRVARPAG